MKPELHRHVIRYASCLFWVVSLAVRQFRCPLRCLGSMANIIGYCASPDAAPIDTKSLCCMVIPVAGAHTIERQDDSFILFDGTGLVALGLL
ncbi:hypothetical protein F9C07_1434223 [Aspergillus flavus]|uniref:Secreted protein n=2 Tax=Aspergillus flavus TaxID=5059 RepID=A0A7U2QVK9_ASPFN|nr:hypothetical protein BDV35DRAFT_250942 [Aspergillus flavus]QRD86189.1 hypothetical protein F9C07_1434223 [Aspergillus flavus]